jgi:hypothetical protein
LIDRPDLVAALAGNLPAVKSIAQDAEEWDAIYTALLRRRRDGFRPAPARVAAVPS